MTVRRRSKDQEGSRDVEQVKSKTGRQRRPSPLPRSRRSGAATADAAVVTMTDDTAADFAAGHAEQHGGARGRRGGARAHAGGAVRRRRDDRLDLDGAGRSLTRGTPAGANRGRVARSRWTANAQTAACRPVPAARSSSRPTSGREPFSTSASRTDFDEPAVGDLQHGRRRRRPSSPASRRRAGPVDDVDSPVPASMSRVRTPTASTGQRPASTSSSTACSRSLSPARPRGDDRRCACRRATSSAAAASCPSTRWS